MQICSNGFISIPNRYTNTSPGQPFPIGRRVIAPYWTDINLNRGGSAVYAVITSGSLLQFVSDFISCNQSLQFSGRLMLVVRFNNAQHWSSSVSGVSKVSQILTVAKL